MSSPLYDIYLGDKALLQGFRCKSITRDTANLLAPKFSSSQQGQTDLDLLKSASVDNLAGGMFQRTHKDPTKSARALGVFNPYDENIYPTPNLGTLSGTFSGAGSVSGKAENGQYSFVNLYQRSAGLSYNYLYKFIGASFSSITLPAALVGTASLLKLSGFCLYKGYLFASTNSGGGAGTNHNYRYDITANTWQDIGVSGSGFDLLFQTLRGVLYMISTTGVIYTVTNETAAGSATYTAVSQVGGVDLQPNEVVEFNGAMWISKADGLYRFDGTTCLKILSFYSRFLTAWNGALWFMVGGTAGTYGKWLYRFDGSSVQKIQYFTDGIITGITNNSDYLFVNSWFTTSAPSDSPKSLGGATGYAQIFAYNGTGFTIIAEKTMTTENSIDYAVICASDYLVYIQPQFSITAWDAVQYFALNLTTLFSTSTVSASSQIDITSSEFDDGFPNVYKSLEAIEVDYSGMINGDVITVKYQTYDGKTWSSWITAGTLTFSSLSPYIEITDYSNKLFKRIKIDAYVSTMTANSTLSVKGLSWRYTLQPRVRFRWQLDIYGSGDSAMQDRSGAPILTDSNYFKTFIDKALRQKTPQFLLTPDYTVINVTIASGILTFVVKGQFPVYTDPYNEYPLIAVLNASAVWEIMRISTVSYNSGSDLTTITVLERGYLGITPASLNSGAEVRLAFKVYLTRLIRDAPVLDPATYNEHSNGNSRLQREYIIEATEA